MQPKITIKEAAAFLGEPTTVITDYLHANNLGYHKVGTGGYFGYETSRLLFSNRNTPKAISFQIVKGGTGKTTIATSFAIRASLLGLKVLCVDLDQQGNMTQAFGVNADEYPVMIDLLVEEYPVDDAIVHPVPGIDLISSRIENAMLDEAVKMTSIPLTKLYRTYFDNLKDEYDLIVVDCPPNLGQSVAAATLAVDMVVSPVSMEGFSLAGLEATCIALDELEGKYHREVDFKILINKFDRRSKLCNKLYKDILNHEVYKNFLVDNVVNLSHDFPNSVLDATSIFDRTQVSQAKKDIDSICKEILKLKPRLKARKHKNKKPKNLSQELAKELEVEI